MEHVFLGVVFFLESQSGFTHSEQKLVKKKTTTPKWCRRISQVTEVNV